MGDASPSQGAQTPVQHVLALPGATACGEPFAALPEGTPVCASCFTATGSVLFGQAQDALDLVNRIRLWCNGVQGQWVPGSEPLRFDQGVGAAAQDVLAIIAQGGVRPPPGVVGAPPVEGRGRD